jgi:hypothetical protein
MKLLACIALTPFASGQVAWPASEGLGGAYASASAGFAAVVGSGGPPAIVIPTVSSASLPPFSSVQAFGSSVVLGAYVGERNASTYVLSGAGSSGWCAAPFNPACSNPDVCLNTSPSVSVAAVSPDGTQQWSTAVPQGFSLPCNFTAGVWINPRLVLHSSLSTVFAYGSW